MVRTTFRQHRGSTTILDLPLLRKVTILAPLVFLAAVEIMRSIFFPTFFHSLAGYVLVAAIILVATTLFSASIFGHVSAMQKRLTQQNQELLALHEAGLAVTAALDLQLVLQNVVDEARELGAARYGALALLDEMGQMQAFLTSGISDELRAKLGPIPEGHGLLGAVLTDPKPLRLPDLTKDPRSVGFPPHHPAMHSLLAVPILSRGEVLGSLYLTERQDQPEFDESDQERLERFATQSALAIENARLHQQMRAIAITEERDRIAREMHDSIAQVLGYVNTKGQAAQQFLQSGRSDRAEEQITQLTRAARDAYADVRENILGLRAAHDASTSFTQTLSSYLDSWQDQSGIAARLNVNRELEMARELSPLAELQLLRIIQEALSNVRKHSEATEAQVSIDQITDGIEAQIADNGTGFNPDALKHSVLPRFGLSTMRERAESVGGSLRIKSGPKGSTVTVMIPVKRTIISANEEHDARTHR